MKISSATIDKNVSKYLLNQKRDIQIYGEKVVERIGVKKEHISAFTPHRRLSQKPGGQNLSDPDWFLKNFEQAAKKDVNLLVEWENLSVPEKLDYIVKHRYRKLIANRIFNATKDEKREHHFLLGENGEIISYDKGSAFRVSLKNCDKRTELLYDKRNELDNKGTEFAHIQAEMPVLSIHNHPIEYNDILFDMEPQFREIMETSFNINKKSVVDPFSITDIINCCFRQINGAVVDQNGNRFFFYPVTFNKIKEKNVDKFIKEAKDISKSKNAEYRKSIRRLNSYSKRKNQDEKEKEKLAKNAALAYIYKFKEIIQNNDYINYLRSAFVRKNLGDFKF